MRLPTSAKSLWLEEALAGAEEAPPLQGGERADVCIVGGGYTGLWTALELKRRQPSLDVVLLEAEVCGAGASGRNGGFVLSWWAKFGSLAKLCGTGEALRLARASARAVAEIGDFCAEHGIDCHYRPDGWMWTATSTAQIGAWRPLVEERSAPRRWPAARAPTATWPVCTSGRRPPCSRRSSPAASAVSPSSGACASSSARR